MAGAGATFKRYLFWTYERGSFHYDVMVTIILAFIFLAPRFMDFRDKPLERPGHPSGILVTPEINGRAVYTIDGSAVDASGDVARQLRGLAETVAGPVKVLDYSVLKDSSGHVTAYRVRVQRL